MYQGIFLQNTTSTFRKHHYNILYQPQESDARHPTSKAVRHFTTMGKAGKCETHPRKSAHVMCIWGVVYSHFTWLLGHNMWYYGHLPLLSKAFPFLPARIVQSLSQAWHSSFIQLMGHIWGHVQRFGSFHIDEMLFRFHQPNPFLFFLLISFFHFFSFFSSFLWSKRLIN